MRDAGAFQESLEEGSHVQQQCRGSFGAFGPDWASP
jgi:hypothetical protein